MSSPEEKLRKLADLKEERGKLYGDNYKTFGKVMHGMFPRGITLEGEEEMGRFVLFALCALKLERYAQNFKRFGHPDSLDDNAVYSMLLQQVDEEIRFDAGANL